MVLGDDLRVLLGKRVAPWLRFGRRRVPAWPSKVPSKASTWFQTASPVPAGNGVGWTGGPRCCSSHPWGCPPKPISRCFRTLRALVLANSTFSYWGSYLSTWWHGRPESVVPPWFLSRADNGAAAWQLDPTWSIIRDIPSGWGLPEELMPAFAAE